MRLHCNEIEPQVAQKLSDFLKERWDRQRDRVSRAWSALCAKLAVLLGLPLLLLAPAMGLHPLFPLLALPAVWLGGLAHFRLARLRHVPEVFTPRLIRMAAEAPSLTASETTYVALLQTLSDASPALGESVARDVLPSLNDLLQNARTLDTQRQRLAQTVGATTPASLVQQRDDLAQRLEQSIDPVIRQTIQQSLKLCDARLEDVRQCEAHLGRLDAQRELVSQMFASIQSSLARLQVVPVVSTVLDVDELRQSVVHMKQQAQAVEQAVQEVTALRRT